MNSPLLALAYSSDVDPLLPDQVARAREVLRMRRAACESGDDAAAEAVLAGQRAVVEAFLDRRRAHFGLDQSRPLPEAARLAEEGRDVFVVVKFMDEAPHLDATIRSLTNQRGIDLGRVVIVAVDNNSTDGSDEIVKRAAAGYQGPARLVYLNQATPGAGNAARLGVDTCIATVHAMCLHDNQWGRLQTATIAVSDGDTVYHPETLRAIDAIFAECTTVDGVMPFLLYKLTAALRLFADYQPMVPERLAAQATGIRPTAVASDLSGIGAHDAFPRRGRQISGQNLILTDPSGNEVEVPLTLTDDRGQPFGVVQDPEGHRGYVFADGNLVLAGAPVSGFDAALVFLENGGVRPDEKWRWHAVVGHDIFLYWAFAGMGLPETMVFPDTSDALKTFRVWSFAIGGQHQLRRPGLRIVTGSDYQSGRILQAVGATVRLGPPGAFAETETDRLIKMARNFVHRQTVFYGETRSSALERASGLYVHMTRIQGDLEAELRRYDDAIFEHTVFPERVIFPLRWLLQNAIRFYSHGPIERDLVRERVFARVFTPGSVRRIEAEILTEAFVAALAAAPFHEKQTLAERAAEEIIATGYPEIMHFYQATLRDFFTANQVDPRCYEWLLDGVVESRNAIVDQPPRWTRPRYGTAGNLTST